MRDLETKLDIEKLLLEKLLPADEGLRLRTLCALHFALKPLQRRALRAP